MLHFMLQIKEIIQKWLSVMFLSEQMEKFHVSTHPKQRPRQENQCLFTGKSENRAARRLSQTQLKLRSSWNMILLQSPLTTVVLCQASDESEP